MAFFVIEMMQALRCETRTIEYTKNGAPTRNAALIQREKLSQIPRHVEARLIFRREQDRQRPDCDEGVCGVWRRE